MAISPTHAHDRGPNLGAERDAGTEQTARLTVSPSVGAAIKAAQERSAAKQPAAEHDGPKAEVAAARGAEGADKQQGQPISMAAKPNEQEIAHQRQLGEQAGRISAQQVAYEGHLEVRLLKEGASKGAVDRASIDQKESALFGNQQVAHVSGADLGHLPKVPDFIGHQAQQAQGAEMARV